MKWLLEQESSPGPDQGWRRAVAQGAGAAEPIPPVTAQLLWQRGWRDPVATGAFLNPDRYTPTSPWAFGDDMEQAIARLIQARDRGEKVAIWGDFDADGLTATAVLWEGLGQFFTPGEQLCYYIPHRVKESHGLSHRGLDQLAAWGCQVLVTCDTGSTAHQELAYGRTLGMEAIVTDHHTLPETQPPVVALINPRQLPPDHPLGDLSGVAVAYKLVEALYDRLPQVPQQALTTLLDLVAIGLIADLVSLRGDCRYLAQRGLRVLEHQAKERVRPGISKLLDFCKRTGDRPSDVAFGLGPRINAVSRIHGDATFGVELLTSRDRQRAEALALEAELANTRRRDLQARVLAEATAQLAQVDLATTQVIVLSNPQWPPGILGLVASQLAQVHGRPVILFQTDVELDLDPASLDPAYLSPVPGSPPAPAPESPLAPGFTPPDTLGTAAVPLARGSARSISGVDLYTLVHNQAPLLTSFGGHPLAAGLTLPVANLPLFTDGINRALRAYPLETSLAAGPTLTIDLEITLADLAAGQGKFLFRALKQLEPYGMGNPIPRLLLRNVQFPPPGDSRVQSPPIKDLRQDRQRFRRVKFVLWDQTCPEGFPGTWWGHSSEDLPQGQCDAVVELDFNAAYKQYELRLIAVHPAQGEATATIEATDWIVDQRMAPPPQPVPPAIAQCPRDWADFPPRPIPPQPLTLAYGSPGETAPGDLWQRWVGLAKYLARTGETVALDTLGWQLGFSAKTLQVAVDCLVSLGFEVAGGLGTSPHPPGAEFSVGSAPATVAPGLYSSVSDRFVQAVQEEQFRRRYFYQVPTTVIQQVLGQSTVVTPSESSSPESSHPSKVSGP